MTQITVINALPAAFILLVTFFFVLRWDNRAPVSTVTAKEKHCKAYINPKTFLHRTRARKRARIALTERERSTFFLGSARSTVKRSAIKHARNRRALAKLNSIPTLNMMLA